MAQKGRPGFFYSEMAAVVPMLATERKGRNVQSRKDRGKKGSSEQTLDTLKDKPPDQET